MKAISFQQKLHSWSWFFKLGFYCAIALGCYMAFTPVEKGIQTTFNDKLLHGVGFFLMAMSAQLAHPKTSFWILGSGLAGFGFAIEMVQAYLPYRSFSMWDWLADVVGVLLYFIFVGHFLRDKSSPY